MATDAATAQEMRCKWQKVSDMNMMRLRGLLEEFFFCLFFFFSFFQGKTEEIPLFAFPQFA